MGVFTGTSVADVYAELLEWVMEPGVLNVLMYDEHPVYRHLPKKKSGGKYVDVPVKIGGTAGLGGSFTQAKANQSAGNYQEFRVPAVSQYAFTTVQGQAISAAKTTRGAFKELMKSEMEGAITNFGRMVSKNIFGAGQGFYGTISSISASGVLTFSNGNDVLAWDKDYAIQCISQGTLVPNSTIGYVTSVSWTNSSMTVSNVKGGAPGNPGTLAGGTAWAVGDTLTVYGNFNNVITGFQGWIPGANGSVRPVTGASSAVNNLFTVDRSQNDTALAGVFYDGRRANTEDCLSTFINRVCKLGNGNPEFVVVGYDSFIAIKNSLQGRHFYIDAEDDAGIGYRAMGIEGPKGPVAIIQDNDCPAFTAYALDMSSAYLAVMSGSDLPTILEEDGNPWLRIAEGDAYEMRLGSYYNLIVDQPMHLGIGLLPV